MNTIYNCACQLCDVSQLKIAMVDVNTAINLVIEINNMIGTHIENDKKI